jgi:hypothetical protein
MKDKWFVCLKHGKKYDAGYVNTLHSMFKRHHTKNIRFACFTEDSKKLNKEIEVFPLPLIPQISGWWYKTMFFDPNLPTQGTILFCDLDVVIFRSIDKFFDYKPGSFCIVRDFNRSIRQDWKKFNSSIFRLDTGDKKFVYENFMTDPLRNSRKFHGDQDWIYSQIRRDYEFFPDEWAQSYKWEMRGRPQMIRLNGIRNFSGKGVPTVDPEGSIAVFHGEPNPHQCADDWVVDNWC